MTTIAKLQKFYFLYYLEVEDWFAFDDTSTSMYVYLKKHLFPESTIKSNSAMEAQLFVG